MSGYGLTVAGGIGAQVARVRLVVDAFQLGHRTPPPRQCLQLTVVSSLGLLLTSPDSSDAMSAMQGRRCWTERRVWIPRKALAMLRLLHRTFTGIALPDLDSLTGHSFGLEFGGVMIEQINGFT